VPPFGFHGIRHLRATILFHQGKSVATIQRFLRLKDPNTTVEYLHSMGLDTMNEELKDLSLGSGQILSFRQGAGRMSSGRFKKKKPSEEPSTPQAAFA